jgi:hypothetical protein
MTNGQAGSRLHPGGQSFSLSAAMTNVTDRAARLAAKVADDYTGPVVDPQMGYELVVASEQYLAQVDAIRERAYKRGRGREAVPTRTAGDPRTAARANPSETAPATEPVSDAPTTDSRTLASGNGRGQPENLQRPSSQNKHASSAARTRAELSNANDQLGHRRAIFDAAAIDPSRFWRPEEIEEHLRERGVVDLRGNTLSLATIDKAMQRMTPHLLTAGQKVKSPISGRMRRTYRVNPAAIPDSDPSSLTNVT